jgi:hypothetical protein
MKKTYRFLALAAVLCVSATASSAQNLLQNGSFDTSVGIVPWTGLGAVPTFSPLDAFGLATSGSIRVINSDPAGSSGVVILPECIGVTGGTSYERRYDYLIEPPSGVTPLVHVQIVWYSDPTCSSGSTIYGEGGDTGGLADGAWHPSPDASVPVVAPPGAQGAQFWLALSKPEAGGSATANFDNVVFRAAGTCAALPDVLCLNQERFQVEATWRTATGSGRAQVVKLTNDTGYLWFFNPDNVEAVVKVLDACAPFGKFWVFAGGLTDVEVDLTVTDTRSGVSRLYHNTLGRPFAPVQDTNAFDTCP